jgi:hypothetical protein
VPARRYSQGRKEFFISAKWISAGMI